MKVDHGRILVADGHQDECELIILALRFAGFDLVGVRDGEEACNFFKVDNPDLILIDVNLPGLSQLAECMEQRDGYAIPVMLLSAERDEDRERFSWAEKAEIITKPISPDQLTRQVERQLRRTRLGRKV